VRGSVLCSISHKLVACFPLWLRRRGFWVGERPRESKRKGIAQTRRIGLVLPVVLEEHAEVLWRQNVVCLQAGRVYGVKWRILIQAGVRCDLPLIVSHSAQLNSNYQKLQ